jgi:chlorite dismutase
MQPATHPAQPASSHGGHAAAAAAHASVETAIQPCTGWHCTHSFYRIDHSRLAGLGAAAVADGIRLFEAALDPAASGAPTRLQSWIVAGHKADFAVVAMDPDPLAVDAVHQRLLAGPLGQAIEPTYSFVSLTEVSEYVPTVEQYARRLVAEGETVDSPSYNAKVQGYAAREPAMRQARLEPEMPSWPNACFYPMNKKRKVGENWFTLPFAERSRLMAEHGASGMKFGGRVTQLITVAVGLDDWEWGVTLWARRPDWLKEIVYTMRFDEASARYAEFGPFFTGYVATPAAILAHCRIVAGA